MSLSVMKLLVGVNEKYYEHGFRVNLEAHISHLLAHERTTILTMQGHEKKRYTSDLAGWLLHKKIKEDYHWIISRMNGYSSPYDYDGLRETFYIPDTSYVDELLERYRSNKI